MADVFISYKSEERAFAQTLAHRLGGEGLTVWLDQQQLRGDSEYYKQLEKAVADAKVVCAVWSVLAKDSRWLHSEAGAADKAGKLINASLDGSVPPWPFERLQCHDLSGWAGNTADDRFQRLVEDLRRVIARGDGTPVAERWLQPDSSAARAWALIQDETDPARYRQFLSMHGASPQGALAQMHLQHIANWRALPQAPSRQKLAEIDQFILSGPFSALGERAKRLRKETLGAVEKLEEKAVENARAEFERAKAEFGSAQRRRFEDLPVTKAAERAKEDAERWKRELGLAENALSQSRSVRPVEISVTQSKWLGCIGSFLIVVYGLGTLSWLLGGDVQEYGWSVRVAVVVLTAIGLLMVFRMTVHPSAFGRDSLSKRIATARAAVAKAEASVKEASTAADEAWKPFQRAIDAFELKRPGA